MWDLVDPRKLKITRFTHNVGSCAPEADLGAGGTGPL